MRFALLLFLLAPLGTSLALLDVAVIGGGPSGLAAAHSALRALGPGARVAVFERSSALAEIGGQVGLMRPALDALDAINPSKTLSGAVEARGVQRTALRRLSSTGELEDEMAVGAKQIVIAWYQLQRALANELPDGVLRLGLELESVENVGEEGTDGVTLRFRNRRDDVSEEPVAARVVVGADGNLSRLRALLFGKEDEVPEYAGSAIWRMFLRGEFPGLETGVSNVWSGDGKVLSLQKMDKDGGETRVYVSGQAGWPEERLGELDRQRYIGAEDGSASGGRTSKAERLERFASLFSEFPQEVIEFAKAHCEQESVLEHPIFFRPPGRPWGRGHATLVGDAAHVIPPNMAMGTPLAFEDAVALGHALAEHGCTEKALRTYEEARMGRVNTIAAAAIEQTGKFYGEKDEDANPFKLNDMELFKFVMDFKQEPVPAAAESSIASEQA